MLGEQTGCSTSVAMGLTAQIFNQMMLMKYNLTMITSTWVTCEAPCSGMLQADALLSLKVAAMSENKPIVMDKAMQSSAQQVHF